MVGRGAAVLAFGASGREDAMMMTLQVAYPATEGTRFDYDY